MDSRATGGVSIVRLAYIVSALLGPVGAGVTSNVHLALVNTSTDLAFKRFLGCQRHLPAARKGRLFRALIQEITNLSLKSVRNHPNIINLEGVCWDIVPEAKEV